MTTVLNSYRCFLTNRFFSQWKKWKGERFDLLVECFRLTVLERNNYSAKRLISSRIRWRRLYVPFGCYSSYLVTLEELQQQALKSLQVSITFVKWNISLTISVVQRGQCGSLNVLFCSHLGMFTCNKGLENGGFRNCFLLSVLFYCRRKFLFSQRWFWKEESSFPLFHMLSLDSCSLLCKESNFYSFVDRNEVQHCTAI